MARRDLQQLIGLEASAVIGVDRHGCREERLNHRHGDWPCSLATKVSDIDLPIPKPRSGASSFTTIKSRRRQNQTFHGVVWRASIGQVFSRLPGRRHVCLRR